MPQRPALAVLAAFACAASLPTGARAGDDRILGLQLAAGAPDGAEATLLFRPLSFLRFEAGATTDLIAPGAHLGITLAVPWYLSPILNLEAGHQWGGDANKLVQLAGLSASSNALLRNVSYSYASAHAGLEFGLPNHFMFFVHAGYSLVRSTTSGLAEFLASQNTSVNLTATREGSVQLIAPSAKVGLLFWIL